MMIDKSFINYTWIVTRAQQNRFSEVKMSQSVSRHLTNFLASHGHGVVSYRSPYSHTMSTLIAVCMLCRGPKRVWRAGAYSIDFVHTLSNEPGISYILASHEGGAVFMAQGYAEASRHSFGCAVTTEGPAALNTVNALACARADGDSVLLVHGAIPLSKSGRGALQDPAAYGCDLVSYGRDTHTHTHTHTQY